MTNLHDHKLIVLAIASVMFGAAVVGCEEETDTEMEQEPTAATEPPALGQPEPVLDESEELGVETTEVDEVQDETSQFVGERVTLAGDTGEVHSDRSFELEGSDWLFDAEVLVLTSSPISFEGQNELEEDQQLIVEGTVRRLVVRDIETELGWDIGTDLESQYRDKPVIIADKLRRVDQEQVWEAGQQPAGSETGQEQMDQQQMEEESAEGETM